MYTVETLDEAEAGVTALPREALAPYAELRTLLETAPWSGGSLNEESPDAPVRQHAFGSYGLVTYLILEDQRRVAILRVIWAG